LDFKRDNYAFAGGTDEQKAELLKDILSIANAFKEADGYIVIGVVEKNGRAESIVGVPPILADHDVHQFINSKTNRPVSFGVENINHDGKSLTVIRVARAQARPLFLRGQFGGLKKNVVYIRHGSSTAEASPDEIREMGKEDSLARQPDVSLIFEVVLETWNYDNAFAMPMTLQKRSEEVDVLRVTAINKGGALAQYVQGRLTIPRGFLLDYIQHRDIEDSWRDPVRTKPVTVKFSNQLREASSLYTKPNPLEWRPLSPGMQLCLLREKFLPVRERIKTIDCGIQWELAIDSCPLRIGEQKLNTVPIIDDRTGS
jgi:Putative DNA-binding domain